MNETKLVLGKIDITALLDAKKILDDGVQSATSDLEKTGAIKSFEFCFELTWKTLKRILEKRGLATTSPRDVFRVDLVFWDKMPPGFQKLIEKDLKSISP